MITLVLQSMNYLTFEGRGVVLLCAHVVLDDERVARSAAQVVRVINRLTFCFFFISLEPRVE